MVSSLIKRISGFYLSSRQLIKSSALSFLMNIGGVVLNFLFALVAGNYCGSKEWGKYSLCLTVLNVVGVLSRIGLDMVIIRISAEEHEKNIGRLKDAFIKSFYIILSASIFIFCLLFFFSDFIAERIFNKPGISYQLKIIALAILPLNLMFLNSESLKGIKHPVASSFFHNVCILLFSLPALLLALSFWKKESITESYVFAVIVSWAISNIIWIKFIPFFKIIREKWISYKAILKQGFPLMLSNSLITLMIWTETLMLGIFRTEAEVGVYNVAFRISLLLIIPLGAVCAVTAPEFAIYNSKKDLKGLQNTLDKANRIIFWTTIPAVLIIALFSTQLLGIFGKEFTGGSISLIFLTVGRFFYTLCGTRGIILPMLGKQNVEQYISFSIVIIDIVLNLIFIPLWGINGAALSTMITTIIWTIISVVYLRKSMKLNSLYIPFAGKLLKIKQ